MIVMLEAATPPQMRDPDCPLNVMVDAELGPARTLNVISEVDPAVILYLKLIQTGPVDVGIYCPVAARASAVVSLNNATVFTFPSEAMEQKKLTVTYNRLLEFVGVIASVINSVPSVFCGIVSSNGMVVVPVAAAPVCVWTACTSLPAGAHFSPVVSPLAAVRT